MADVTKVCFVLFRRALLRHKHFPFSSTNCTRLQCSRAHGLSASIHQTVKSKEINQESTTPPSSKNEFSGRNPKFPTQNFLSQTSPENLPSRSTSSESPSPSFPNPQPNYRWSFFHYLRNDVKYERSTYRADGKTVAEAEPSMAALVRQLSTYISLRTSEAFPRTLGDSTLDPRNAILSEVEEQCAAAAEKLSLDSVLLLADLWYTVAQLDLRVPRFHRVLLDRISQEPAPLSIPQIVQTLLYSAAYRRISPAVREKLTTTVLEQAFNLDTPQIDLIAFAAYVLKLDFRAHTAFLSLTARTVLETDLDSTSFVNILKFLRQNEFTDTGFIQRLSGRLRPVSFDTASAVKCCYVLQAFTSMKHYDEDLFHKLQTRIMKSLAGETELYSQYPPAELLQLHPSRRTRAKDLASYLYSMSAINFTLEKTDLIVSDLKNRFRVGEFASGPGFLVQSLYALSVQGVYDAELLGWVFSPSITRKLSSIDLKDAQRWLYSLFKTCQIEFPEGLPTGGVVTEDRLAAGLHQEFFFTGFEMRYRDQVALERVEKRLREKYGKEAVSFGRAVPHLEVSGFQVRLPSTDLIERLKNPKLGSDAPVDVPGKRISVDVMDAWTCAGNVRRPLGVTVLKQRLLAKLGWVVVNE